VNLDLDSFTEKQLRYLKSKINTKLSEKNSSSIGDSNAVKVHSMGMQPPRISKELIYKPKKRSVIEDELDQLTDLSSHTNVDTAISNTSEKRLNFKDYEISAKGFFRKKKRRKSPIQLPDESALDTNRTVELIDKKIREYEQDCGYSNIFKFK